MCVTVVRKCNEKLYFLYSATDSLKMLAEIYNQQSLGKHLCPAQVISYQDSDQSNYVVFVWLLWAAA
jgi:hypothetical protein